MNERMIFAHRTLDIGNILSLCSERKKINLSPFCCPLFVCPLFVFGQMFCIIAFSDNFFYIQNTVETVFNLIALLGKINYKDEILISGYI
jgi:hypothetical protein